MKSKTAEYINILGRFCGKRDIPALDHDCLFGKYQIHQADVMVLFGGSILAGGDVLARAIRDKAAACYVIVGGAGHTTESLRQRVHRAYPFIETGGLSAAEIFQRYLGQVHGCQADLLETRSTNCGNNIINLLALLDGKGIRYRNIILCQDATMQHRMDATLRKYRPDVRIINYASYKAVVQWDGDRLAYEEHIHGMWDMDRYVNLLMGEIPRLTDGPEGYGPRGRQFIAHVDIPEEVQTAFEGLQKVFGTGIREANPLFA